MWQTIDVFFVVLFCCCFFVVVFLQIQCSLESNERAYNELSQDLLCLPFYFDF